MFSGSSDYPNLGPGFPMGTIGKELSRKSNTVRRIVYYDTLIAHMIHFGPRDQSTNHLPCTLQILYP